MLDGIETSSIAVNERDLVKRLNMSQLFSSTHGDIRYDMPLAPINYKGMRLYPKLRGQYDQDSNRHWFSLRGSLIKLANNGLHNHDAKDPFQILCALDNLFIELRIDPFRTALSGLEMSATIKTNNPEQICASILSYINRPPSRSTLNRTDSILPYIEIEAGQHKLKVYAPQPYTLRVEIKVDRMQFLGNNRPMTFADLVQPQHATLLATILLTAFKKIMWKCPSFDPDRLAEEERTLYLRGLDYEYWHVQRSKYANESEFKRIEKDRSRKKKQYNQIVAQNWVQESPTEIVRRIEEQLDRSIALMHTDIYQALLNICLERWQYVGNLPGILRLPKHLELPHLSEIYPLYLGRFPTPLYTPQTYPIKQDLVVDELDLFSDYTNYTSQQNHLEKSKVKKHQSSSATRFTKGQLTHISKTMNAAGGLNYPIDEVVPILSARSKLALAYCQQTLNELTYSVTDHRPTLLWLTP
ncbi:hypothetical protein [Spirosoma jeollabukense]